MTLLGGIDQWCADCLSSLCSSHCVLVVVQSDFGTWDLFWPWLVAHAQVHIPAAIFPTVVALGYALGLKVMSCRCTPSGPVLCIQ